MYLLDTNILIYHFNKSIPDESRLEIIRILKDHFNVSIISKMEFLGYKNHTDESFNKAADLIDNANIIHLDNEIAKKTISLKRTINIKLADAIIASTAIIKDFTLVTRNADDFKGLDLKIYNPFDIKNSE